LRADRRGMCPYCGKQIATGHFDHVIPLSRGGTNARENILWVCAQCNLQKRDKLLVDFLVSRDERR
jgi:5-methylcytosine-specific restriction endonuclease McrA